MPFSKFHNIIDKQDVLKVYKTELMTKENSI